LMAMLVVDEGNSIHDNSASTQLTKVRIGHEGQIQATADSRLLLKVNDKASDVLDNSGNFRVEITVLGSRD
jgi:hypothetical protein